MALYRAMESARQTANGSSRIRWQFTFCDRRCDESQRSPEFHFLPLPWYADYRAPGARLGVPKPTAIVAVLGYRLFSFWLPTVIGIALVPLLGARGKRTGTPEIPGA
jgi:hypothetical protein